MYVSRVALHRQAIAACTPFRLQICMALPFCFYPFRTHLAFQKNTLSFSIHQGTFSKTRQRESENKLSLGRMHLPHPCIRASTARALLQHRTPSCGRLHRSERWRHGAAMPAGLHMVHNIKFVNICSVSSMKEEAGCGYAGRTVAAGHRPHIRWRIGWRCAIPAAPESHGKRRGLGALPLGNSFHHRFLRGKRREEDID